MDWETTAQSWGSELLKGAIDAKVNNPFELQKLQLQALGQTGYYNEGQRGAITGAPVVLPSGLLLLGGIALAIFLLKD